MFPQYHFIETWHKVGIKEPAVEDSKTENPSNEFEVTQVIRVDSRARIYLQSIVVVRRILKQTITWIENFMREKEEPFPRFSALVNNLALS